MRFFQRFPTLEYRLTEYGANTEVQLARTVPNMTVSLQLVVGDEEGSSFLFYRIKDRDRPDTVAAQFYGSSEYAWVVLLANNMRDWYDWPLDDREFYDYIARKHESVVGARDGVPVAQQTPYERLWLRPDGQQLVLDHPAYLAKIAEGVDVISGVDAFDPSQGRDAVCIVSLYTKEYNDNDARRLIRLPALSALAALDQRLSDLLKA